MNLMYHCQNALVVYWLAE